MYKQIVTHEDWEQQKKKKKERLKKKENELKETPVEREKTHSLYELPRDKQEERNKSQTERKKERSMVEHVQAPNSSCLFKEGTCLLREVLPFFLDNPIRAFHAHVTQYS